MPENTNKNTKNKNRGKLSSDNPYLKNTKLFQ